MTGLVEMKSECEEPQEDPTELCDWEGALKVGSQKCSGVSSAQELITYSCHLAINVLFTQEKASSPLL